MVGMTSAKSGNAFISRRWPVHGAAVVLGCLTWLMLATAHAAPNLLFVGNSFLYGAGAAVRFYRADTVTDLNGSGVGGVPALVKSFFEQTGLEADVFMELQGGSNFDFHAKNKSAILQKPWDRVVMHGYSTLDAKRPRHPGKLIEGAVQVADLLRRGNPQVQIHLLSTWSRADQTYLPGGTWSGQPIEAMAIDIRVAYDQAALAVRANSVIPVGQAWNRAFALGVADPNPYDGIAPGQMNLWATDHYHASDRGYYLEALVIFGALSGMDPRTLGEGECSAFELGLSTQEVRQLQKVAFEELASTPGFLAAQSPRPASAKPSRCRSGR
jgi:hypothetical protein